MVPRGFGALPTLHHGERCNQGLTGILSVDVNERLLDGRPNPYLLRPYVFQSEPRLRDFPLTNDTYRTQAAYKLDFGRDEGWRKWLGTHNLVGYGEYKEKDQKVLTDAEQIVSPNSWQFPSATGNRTAGQPVRSFYLYYVGDNVGQNIEYAPGRSTMGITPTPMATPSPASSRTKQSPWAGCRSTSAARM